MAGGNRRQRRRRGRKPLTMADCNGWLRRSKHPNSGETRLRQLLSGLPPTNFTFQHHILYPSRDNRMDVRNRHIRSAPAVTKSWRLPATTRCGGASNRPPQLRHVIAGRPEKPNPHERGRSPGRAFWFSSISDRLDCAILDPFDASEEEYMEVTSAVEYGGGKYYGVSMQGAVVEMEVKEMRRIEITAVGSTRAVPSPASRVFEEYLFEMEGEVVLVQLVHYESVERVDGVKVYRLDLKKLEWKKVERVEGKTMFLKERCEWVDSAEYGCRDNCVFFMEGKEKKWRVFDFKTCCISSV